LGIEVVEHDEKAWKTSQRSDELSIGNRGALDFGARMDWWCGSKDWEMIFSVLVEDAVMDKISSLRVCRLQYG